MYSIVLATMLTTGSATPTHFFHGCRGCHGCCGGCWGNAFSCYGCCGGCHGCCGGCWGCYGCCGGCCGYYAAPVYYGCGCCGGVVVPNGNGNGKKKDKEELPEATEEDTGDQSAAPRSATVVVNAPLDVKVRFNGQVARRTATEQRFITPRLERGRTYSYEIEAEAVRDGEVVTKTEKILVRAGKIARIDLGKLAAAKPVAQPTTGKARLTVLLPVDAKLYVDGVACPLHSAKRSFETPKLQSGRTYYYTLKVEAVRDGETVTDGRRVTIRSGDNLVVDFKDLSQVEQSASR